MVVASASLGPRQQVCVSVQTLTARVVNQMEKM